MSAGPQVAYLPDRRRLHLHHGPIDLIIDAEGPARAPALRAAADRFEGLLDGLVGDLGALRSPVSEAVPVTDPVAQAMVTATRPFGDRFVTPMAAVAGAVADAVLAAMRSAGPLRKAYVNNGGDIAFFCAPGVTMRIASDCGPIEIPGGGVARGVATSGWRGRSQSMGIADAVTVFAATAAVADVAATLICNAVTLPGHPAIRRRPANAQAPDSDLGARLVTCDVAALSGAARSQALRAGEIYARRLAEDGLIDGALLLLQGETRVVSRRDADTPIAVEGNLLDA